MHVIYILLKYPPISNFVFIFIEPYLFGINLFRSTKRKSIDTLVLLLLFGLLPWNKFAPSNTNISPYFTVYGLKSCFALTQEYVVL